MTQISFINSVKDGAIQGWHTHKILPSLTISQAILESGWGGSSLAKPPNNNLFGIKASPDWTGQVVRMPTQEWNGSQMVTIYDNFRVYPTANASILDHSAFFTNTEWRKNNYRAVIGEKDYRQACYAVSQAGYATDPNYPSKLINIIESNNLQRFDQEAFNGNIPPIEIPELEEKPSTGGSDPSKSVDVGIFDTQNYVNVSRINYKDDMLVSPEGESIIYNPTLNDQFVFTPKGAETMWIDQIYEQNTDNYIFLMEEAINFMRERSQPDAQYTVGLRYLPDSIAIGDTGEFIDHEFNPPLYIKARVLDIITSETDPDRDSVVIGNVTEFESKYQAELSQIQQRLQETRKDLLKEFYEAGEIEVFLDASNGTSLSINGTQEKRELIVGKQTITPVQTEYEYTVKQPSSEHSERLLFMGKIQDNVIDHTEEVPLGILEAPAMMTALEDESENPQGGDVPYIDPAMDVKELKVERFSLELVNEYGAVVRSASIPVRIDSHFSSPIKKTSQTIDKIRIKSTQEIVIEDISFVEPSSATEQSESTVLTARIMQNSKDVTDQYSNFQWTRTSGNPALDDIWNEQNKFVHANSLTVYPSDIEGENSTFICKAFDGNRFISGGSTQVSVIKALSAYEVAVRDGFEGSEHEWLVSLKGQDGKGLPGEPGKNGMVEYTHIAYANSPDGMKDFSVEKAHGESYEYIGMAKTMAIAGDPIPNDPIDPSVYSWVHVKGDKGDPGISITGVIEKYKLSKLSTGETTSGDWVNAPQTPTSDFPYLWNYEIINYSEGQPTITEPAVIGMYSADGTSIVNIEELYALSSTEQQPSDSNFSPGVKVTDETNKYLWNKEVITLKHDDGKIETIEHYALIGVHGEKGKDGKTSYFHRAYADDLTGGGFTTTESLNKKFMGTYSSFDPEPSQNYQDYQWQRMAEDYAKEFQEELDTKAPNESVIQVVNEISSLRALANSKIDANTFNQQTDEYKRFLTMLDTAVTNVEALAKRVENANVEILTDLQDQAERWFTQDGYIQIDGATNTFTISNQVDSSQIIVDNEGIKFMDGGVMVGIITGQYLRIMRGIFAESVQIDKFKFEPFAGDRRRLFLSYLRGEE